jgi:hypothetical protein
MATVFVIKQGQAELSVIARIIKHYAQSLVEKNEDEDMLIVPFQRKISIVEQIRGGTFWHVAL